MDPFFTFLKREEHSDTLGSKQAMAAISSSLDEYKPALAMMVVQCVIALATLAAKACFSRGITPLVFITYRQAVASLVLLPTTLVLRGPRKMALGLRDFCLVFAASLLGGTLFQYFYCVGLKMTSASTSSAMNNLIPVVTFMMAVSFGLEKVTLRSIRSMAKVLGAIICVGGAIFMAFYKGPKLLSMEFQTLSSILKLPSTGHWTNGFIFLAGSTCCGSLWIILQVPICKNCVDPLSFATWMCIISTFQSGFLTYFLEWNPQAWKITSTFEILLIVYAGIFASGVNFYLQSWVISIRGPVFATLFNPIQIMTAMILAFLLLDEELQTGSLIGDVAVVGGLYIVLWGKAGDIEVKEKLILEDNFRKKKNSVDALLTGKKDGVKAPLLQGLDDLESQMKVEQG